MNQRLARGIQPSTLNRELYDLQQFLRFLADVEQPICARMLRVTPLKTGPGLHRDVPLDQLRRLRQEIEGEAASAHAGRRRMGLMDQAWFLLMLHSGLRTGEVRRLRLGDLDLAGKRVRIEQSKGLKDRVVYLSQPTVAALEAYLVVRGAANTDHLFLFRHQPLGTTYCAARLRSYGQRCGLHITAHQLRHSCTILLLNTGAPILTVQAILGHKHIDTALAYARLYDGTVASPPITTGLWPTSKAGWDSVKMRLIPRLSLGNCWRWWIRCGRERSTTPSGRLYKLCALLFSLWQGDNNHKPSLVGPVVYGGGG